MNPSDANPAAKRTCAKCGGNDFSGGELRGSCGIASSFFNLQNEGFADVACNRCGYSEFYRRPISDLQKLFDFTGG